MKSISLKSKARFREMWTTVASLVVQSRSNGVGNLLMRRDTF